MSAQYVLHHCIPLKYVLAAKHTIQSPLARQSLMEGQRPVPCILESHSVIRTAVKGWRTGYRAVKYILAKDCSALQVGSRPLMC
jgi:hypothetical protein